MQEVKRIVVIGPESTGKSTLCSSLADHYKTLWCEEYAREYLLKHGTTYTYDNLLEIAKGQLALEDEYIEKVKGFREEGERFKEMSEVSEVRNNIQLPINSNDHSTINHQLLFVDTDMYVMKVWCEFVFNKCHQFILDKIVERPADLYLLCNIDLPWVKDELREYPDLENRKKLYHIYKDLLINQSVPWKHIEGTYEHRFGMAVEAVNAYLLTGV